MTTNHRIFALDMAVKSTAPIGLIQQAHGIVHDAKQVLLIASMYEAYLSGLPKSPTPVGASLSVVPNAA